MCNFITCKLDVKLLHRLLWRLKWRMRICLVDSLWTEVCMCYCETDLGEEALVPNWFWKFQMCRLVLIVLSPVTSYRRKQKAWGVCIIYMIVIVEIWKVFDFSWLLDNRSNSWYHTASRSPGSLSWLGMSNTFSLHLIRPTD